METARIAFAAALLAVAASLPAAAETIGKCELHGRKGEFPFTPAQPGRLTVEVNLPAPVWWDGDTPQTVDDGYEYCMAADIAWRAGLDKVAVVNVAWDALVAGQTKGFDLALNEISVTDERKKVVDFSIPYFHSDAGILVRKGTAVDSESIKGLRFGVQQASTGADFVQTKLKPAGPIKVFPDEATMFTALVAGQVDVVITDTAIVLGEASQSHGTLEVPGQYSTGETYAAIYPKGSPNEAVLDRIIQSLIDDGVLKDLSARYLGKSWGADPATIPYFKY
ncbi:MAG TPA: ABC transporter substrate-binding protein [Dongiaceae bacterium]|nr:ABC transporter substrate-binding protein [Dongiaceae bacterium]